MKHLLFILACCFSLGCATPHARWYLNGNTEQQFNKVDSHCFTYANQQMKYAEQTAAEMMRTGSASLYGSGIGMAISNNNTKIEIYEKCMESYGFTKCYDKAK